MSYVFGTVIYKEALAFLDEFIQSLNQQTSNNVDYLFINDNLNDHEIEYVKSIIKGNIEIVKGKEGASPSYLRYQLIKSAYDKNYELLILGDCDDTFERSRFEVVIDTYHKNPNAGFIYNQLKYLDDLRCVFEYLPQSIRGPEALLEYNFVGLSNSSINLKQLDDAIFEAIINCKTHIFDWFLFSLLLSHHREGVFAQSAVTYYRIHQSNTVGIIRNEYKDFENEYNVKMIHYELLQDYDVIWKVALDKYQRLNLSDFVKLRINREVTEKDFYWWSKIKILKGEQL